MIRAMIPHGDRRDGAQSGCIENQEPLVRPLDDDIVSVLVLCENVRHGARRLLGPQPGEDVAERALFLQLGLQCGDLAGSDTARTTNRNLSQCGSSMYA